LSADSLRGDHGQTDEQTVKETLEAFKAVGVDQYLIYARSGLEYEYMGEEWMQMCEWFCKHAKRLDMKIWLYDEYNWPSGSCKGRVPAENPDYESRSTQSIRNPTHVRLAGGPFAGLGGQLQLQGHGSLYRADAQTVRAVSRRLSGNRPSSASSRTSRRIPPRFSSRTSPRCCPLFRRAEDEYKAATGRDLRTDVQAYLTDASKDDVWGVYYNLLGERFRKAYFDQIRAWCDRVGLLATGHMISENSTYHSALYNGRPLLALKGLSLPGMDRSRTRLVPDKIEWLTLAVAQHAIGRRGHGGLVELFACGPCDMTLAAERQMLWLCALHKIDHLLSGHRADRRAGQPGEKRIFHVVFAHAAWFPAFRLLGARRASPHAMRPTVLATWPSAIRRPPAPNWPCAGKIIRC
jgi:hypothetical protein